MKTSKLLAELCVGMLLVACTTGCVRSLNETRFDGILDDRTQYGNGGVNNCDKPKDAVKDVKVQLNYEYENEIVCLGETQTDVNGFFAIVPQLPKTLERKIRRSFNPQKCKLSLEKPPYTTRNDETNYLGGWTPKQGVFKPSIMPQFRQNGALDVLIELGEKLIADKPLVMLTMKSANIIIEEEEENTGVVHELKWSDNKYGRLSLSNYPAGKYRLQILVQDVGTHTYYIDICNGRKYSNDDKFFFFEKAQNELGETVLISTISVMIKPPTSGEISVFNQVSQ